MDKYLLAVIALIVFSIIIILFVRSHDKKVLITKKTVDLLQESDFTILE